MQIGVTGHQGREGIEWGWVRDTISAELSNIPHVTRCLSSLASGTDQVFAETAHALGIPVVAVIPLRGYKRYFNGKDLEKYETLLRKCTVIQLDSRGDDEQAFLEAGRKIVEKSDLMLAVWDGNGAAGKGGTGDIVSIALVNKKPVLHIDPITRSVKYI
jgi:hypothetical protein